MSKTTDALRPLALATSLVTVAVVSLVAVNVQNGDPNEIKACYNRSGTIYRIGVPDQPDECRGEDTEFSWSQTGPTFVGQTCPAGQSVFGFDAIGNLICERPGGPFGTANITWTVTKNGELASCHTVFVTVTGPTNGQFVFECFQGLSGSIPDLPVGTYTFALLITDSSGNRAFPPGPVTVNIIANATTEISFTVECSFCPEL